MKMICAPSQVIREGSDLNQHGQAARHEQASSNSPVTFQETFEVSAALTHELRAMVVDNTEANKLFENKLFIAFFRVCCFGLPEDYNVRPELVNGPLRAIGLE